MPLLLEIVTPERLAYSDTVDSVQLPGIEGELGVLPHHAPLVSMLGVGELRIRKGGAEESFAIAGGFLQVRPDRVVVTTIVEVRNRRGRVYSALVRRIHPWVVRTMLARAVDAMAVPA